MGGGGGYSLEPPGDIHTVEVPEDVEEMMTPFDVSGACIYVDPDGTPNGVEDVFTKPENARQRYTSNGIGLDFLHSLTR